MIPGAYLVVFESGTVAETSVSALADSLVAGTSGTVTHVFMKTLRGFAAKDLDDAWADKVSRRSDVSFVRKDFRIYGDELRGTAFDPVPWNLDRVDQRTPFSLDRDFRLKTGGLGAGPQVPIYVLDNGVYRDHQEFAGAAGSRVTDVADVTGTGFARCSGTDAGHGTGVASIAAGARLGITPTLIRNVKVLSRNPFGSCKGGSPTTVLAGLERTYDDMVAHGTGKGVVNLSLSWVGPTPDVATAIEKLQLQGAIVVAAAGNENMDAANVVPASLPNVLAVGATDIAGARAVFTTAEASNFGPAVDLWAPGSNIKAADWTAAGDLTATTVTSGTSEAAPHVAGAAALLWQQNPTLSASQVMSELVSRATRNMLTNLGAGSKNALLYVGEDAPTKGKTVVIPRAGGGGDLRAVRVSADTRRVYVAGGDSAGGGPYSYAAYDTADLNAPPVWQALQSSTSAGMACTDIYASKATLGPPAGVPVYFGCEGTHAGGREAAVVAAREDGSALWGPVWLGPGSSIDGGTVDNLDLPFRLFVIATRPTQTGHEVFVTSLDAESGQTIGSKVLAPNGFNEPFHRAAGLGLVEEAGGSSELVAATYSDPPGPDKTFLWKIDPGTLDVVGWREVPVPQLATNGMFATALAVQDREGSGNLVVPGQVFLATQVGVSAGGGTAPWAYLYRLKPDRVTADVIDVVKDAHVSSLWSEDGDLYFAGTTTRTFPPGSLSGVPKTGAAPDYDAFLGKSEGAVGSRRWMRAFDPPGAQNNSGYGSYGAKKAYLVGGDSTASYLVEYAVY